MPLPRNIKMFKRPLAPARKTGNALQGTNTNNKKRENLLKLFNNHQKSKNKSTEALNIVLPTQADRDAMHIMAVIERAIYRRQQSRKSKQRKLS